MALGLMISSPKRSETTYVSGFSVKSLDSKLIVFTKFEKNVLKIVRNYFLPEKDDKEENADTITQRTHLINSSNSAIFLKTIRLSLGSIPATEGDITCNYLNFGHLDGQSLEFMNT
jgi:hypothetical protein